MVTVSLTTIMNINVPIDIMIRTLNCSYSLQMIGNIHMDFVKITTPMVDHCLENSSFLLCRCYYLLLCYLNFILIKKFELFLNFFIC